MTITFDILNPESVKAARKELQKYKYSLKRKCDRLCKRLAEIGLAYAQVYFSNVEVDLDRFSKEPLKEANIFVTYAKGREDGYPKYTITANGTDIAFIEFGAGVRYNSGGDSYHETRPEGIVGIGEYGKGRGKNLSWVYYGADGQARVTSGTPEQPGMYLSAKEMRSKIEEIAREVFATHDRH